jgi:hypothetical protein
MIDEENKMSMNDLDVLISFLKMPLGSSDEVFAKFASLPGAIHRGADLSQFLFVKGKRENRVLLVAHADTVWDNFYCGVSATIQQKIVQKNGIINNSKGGLGADDRAGCAMLWLLKDMGHSLLVTNGEEEGRLGSNWLMNENPDIADEINNNHQFVIQLDRRNGNDFKCYSVGTDEFRTYVEDKTGFNEPDRSSFTDIVTLCRDIAGVNLSIAYHQEHRDDEYLNISEWENTLDICRNWLSEVELPHFSLRE